MIFMSSLTKFLVKLHIKLCITRNIRKNVIFFYLELELLEDKELLEDDFLQKQSICEDEDSEDEVGLDGEEGLD